MLNQELQIFSTLLDWLTIGHRSWLCTITSTWGSSPRPVGSMMLVNDKGQQIGSLSGGCIEQDLIDYLQSNNVNKPIHCIYGETEKETERYQLPCGGKVGVLIEPTEFVPLSHWQEIHSAIHEGRGIGRSVDYTHQQYEVVNKPLVTRMNKRDQDILLFETTILSPTLLFIVGANDVSQHVAQLATWMNYQVIVCDPRPEKLQDWPMDNCTLLAMLPDEALSYYAKVENLHIIALTHDPRIDDMALLAAFDTDASYIGAMGSMRTSEKRRARLKSLGITEQQLLKLDAPIGLSIGSKTPKEIAIAIVAGLIARKQTVTKEAIC